MRIPDAPLRLWLIARPSPEARTLEAALVDAGASVQTHAFPTSDGRAAPGGLAGLAGLASDLGAALREVVEGVDIAEAICDEYGESPDQWQVQSKGNAYLTEKFPNLDYIKKATLLDD